MDLPTVEKEPVQIGSFLDFTDVFNVTLMKDR